MRSISFANVLAVTASVFFVVEAQNCSSIPEIACSLPQFSQLCSLLDLVGPLRETGLTVFAPTNAAFVNLGMDALRFLLQPAQVKQLTEIVLFHFSKEGEFYLDDLNCTMPLKMLKGISRTKCDGDLKFQSGHGNEVTKLPKIIESDIKACEGIIHVVNNVMLLSD